MLTATLLLMGLGLAASVMLVIASRIFYVWEDPRIERVEEALLGANCGGCGYAGCSAAAEAVVFGKAKPDVCVAGGFEIAQGVAAVMGLSVEEKEPEISKPGCTYGVHEAELKYMYAGVPDCRAAVLLYGGSKECNIGCLGLSTCVRACPFGALSMGANNLPLVDKDKCTSCGICAEVCPKDIITVTSAAKRIVSDITLSDCTAPCQRTCPAEIDIPEYIRQISTGNYLGAVRVIKEKNPFPLVCGWLCPAPCESQCRRHLVDEPVTINALKKFVSNYEKETGKRADYYLPPASGKAIAVVGGGVEGLTAAYYLRRLGYQPKLWEATGKMGGILRYVITEDRLPRDVLDWDIDGILETGVASETGKLMGKDFTLASLFRGGSDMVLTTTGGWDSRQIMRGKNWGEQMIPGTFLLLDFLVASSKGTKIPMNGNVVIIGGGKTAADAVDTCLKNGAEEITVAFPFTRDRGELYDIDLNRLQESGKVTVLFAAVPMELRGEGDRLTGITLRLKTGKITSLDTEEVREMDLPLDRLIVGSGRFPEMLFVREGDEEKRDTYKWKTIEIGRALPGEAPEAGIFAVAESGRPSDIAGAVIAVRRGRKAARAIHLFISEEEIAPQPGLITQENEHWMQNVETILNPVVSEAPRPNVNSIMTLNEEETQAEAERCLACGLLCYRKSLDLN